MNNCVLQVNVSARLNGPFCVPVTFIVAPFFSNTDFPISSQLVFTIRADPTQLLPSWQSATVQKMEETRDSQRFLCGSKNEFLLTPFQFWDWVLLVILVKGCQKKKPGQIKLNCLELPK